MKIGIDFNDITADFFTFLLDWHNKKYKRNDKREEFKSFSWWPVWETSREEAIKRVAEFLESHKVEDMKPMKDAIYSLNKLSEKNELIIITGRQLVFKSKTEEWLLHHLKKKLEIIHAGEFHKGQAATKAEICKERGIPILIEDAGETCMDCAKQGIKVIVFDNSWNQGIEHKNIIRVNNWKEALEAIKILEKQLKC